MSKSPSTSRPCKRWFVERAGAPSGLGYGRRWIAMYGFDRATAVGQDFATWHEAMTHAVGPLVSEATA